MEQSSRPYKRPPTVAVKDRDVEKTKALLHRVIDDFFAHGGEFEFSLDIDARLYEDTIDGNNRTYHSVGSDFYLHIGRKNTKVVGGREPVRKMGKS